MPRARSKSANDASDTEDLPFEAALERLEAVVDRLEQGDLELEQSLAAFEEGVRLSKRCAGQLDAAEQRIEVLVKEGSKWLARSFVEADAVDEEDAVEDED